MLETLKEKWNDILKYLKEEYDISDVSFDTWLLPLEVYALEQPGNIVKIIVPDANFLGYIKKKYSTMLMVSIAEVTGIKCDSVQFLVEEDIVPEPAAANQLIRNTASAVSPATLQNANLNPKYTFDTFVVGANNNLAHAASLAVAESPGEIYNPLFIYGGVGLGKTHLMHSIANFILKNNPKAKILYVTSEKFTNELIDAIRNKNNISTTEFREKYRNNDVLLIDDIQFIIGKESTQEEFFHTFNSLYECGKQIILTSDRPPKEIKTLEDRLRTRFEWGLLVDVQPPDFETRMAIISRKADSLGLDLPEDVAAFIAGKLKDNVRQLEGVVKRLDAHANLTGAPITMLLAENAIQDIMTEQTPLPVTVDRIIDEVARTYGVTAEDIRGQRRSNQISTARQVAMYVVREITGMTQLEIGQEFGGRDHSTVVYALQQVTKAIQTDPRKKEVIEDIIKNIRNLNG